MIIKIGQTVRVNGGEIYKVAKLWSSGKLLTTTGEEFDLWFDIIEKV